MTQRAYRIRWKKRSNLQESRTTRNVVNEYMDAGREVVGDKGYHGNDILVELVEQEYRSYYISEPAFREVGGCRAQMEGQTAWWTTTTAR